MRSSTSLQLSMVPSGIPDCFTTSPVSSLHMFTCHAHWNGKVHTSTTNPYAGSALFLVCPILQTREHRLWESKGCFQVHNNSSLHTWVHTRSLDCMPRGAAPGRRMRAPSFLTMVRPACQVSLIPHASRMWPPHLPGVAMVEERTILPAFLTF